MAHVTHITEFGDLPVFAPALEAPAYGVSVIAGQTASGSPNTFNIDDATKYLLVVVAPVIDPGPPPVPVDYGVARGKFGTFTLLEGAVIPPGVPTWFACPGGTGRQFTTIDA